MGKVIVIANQKGGVGKTTTSINLSACLANKNKKTLTIDIDPQGNASSGLGINTKDLDKTVYELLLGEASMDECTTKTVVKKLSLVPSNINLTGAEIELLDMPDKEHLLKKGIAEVRDKYDFIIIDCPPSLNILTLNALTAADQVIVPVQCEYYALEGLTQLIYTINLVKKSLNPDLSIAGLVFTMFDSRTNLSQDVVDNVKENVQQYIYKTIIPRNIRLAEAPSYGLPIIMYDPKSSGAHAYKKLAKEVIAQNKKKIF